MLRHIVIFKFKEDCSEEQLKAVADGMNALPAKIPQIVSYKHGKDAGVADSKFDYVLVADFESAEDFLAYRVHPDHQAFGQTVMPLIADVSQIQFYC